MNMPQRIAHAASAPIRPTAFLWFICFLLFHSVPSQAEVQPASVSFYDDINPLLSVHCFKCHSAETQKGGLRLDNLPAAKAGGKSGEAAVVPGSSHQSELVRRLTSSDPDEQMPPKGPKLTAEEISRIKTWIDSGAPWPERDDYWAFQPPREPTLPHVANRTTLRNPIDLFIHSRLQKAAIEPAGTADARTLLRRAFADLLGVPPSPQEAERFLKDGSADAYNKLIDRLLEDPRYGERWARYWLDLVRYGESDGYEDDKIRPHAWRYRDYVIRSFNADKPYDRFIQEQIAGDELWPESADAWIATGFARLGAWDAMSKDPAQQRQDFLNDATDVLGAAFLGMTLGCARCHDHKYDRITQKDYYQIQAFFAGTKRELHDLPATVHEPAEVTAAYRTDSKQLRAAKTERDSLLQAARAALQAKQELGAGEKKKISDSEVNKKVEADHPGKLSKLNAQIKTLEARVRLHEPKAEAFFGSSRSKTKTHILGGGELARPGAEVKPGFAEAMLPAGTAPPANHTRSELARWLTDPQHPLTARVLVNRLWQHHFGAGLVATPSDFGRNGRRPTHPELLDWLARRFVSDGYSLKKMHRLIMTSETYRRSSQATPSALSKDPENKLLWRMNRRRLEAEAIRDTILTVSGLLNPTMGGPGVYAKLPQGVNVQFPNNDKELSWGASTPAEDARRSIYLFQRRTLTYPLMDVFDAAPMNQSCPARAQTTVAPQALALFNGEYARKAAAHFAERLRKEAGSSLRSQVERGFQLAFTRPPLRSELTASLQFLQEQTSIRKNDSAPTQAALQDFCHALLNANELLFLD